MEININDNIDYENNEDNLEYLKYKQEYDQNYGNYADTFKGNTDTFTGTGGLIQGCVFNENYEHFNINTNNNDLIHRNEMININENENENHSQDLEDMQIYNNYQFRANIEEIVDIQYRDNDNDNYINNQNDELIENYQDVNNNINNIQSNIEIFEDVNNHIEEINENQ
jgi:hypothetical protein